MKLIDKKIDFEKFAKVFKITQNCEKNIEVSNFNNIYLNEIINKFGSTSFNNGLFRIYNAKEVRHNTKKVEEAFPNAKNKIISFGRDWINREFAVKIEEPYHIFQFDIDFNDVLDIPVDLKTFFEEEVIEYTNSLFAEYFFYQWQKSTQNRTLLCNECVTYKIPMSLGGKDEVNNLEICDSDISWEINSQLKF